MTEISEQDAREAAISLHGSLFCGQHEWHVLIKWAIQELVSRQSRWAEREVAVRPTQEQLASACLSYCHSFGLFSEQERENLMTQAKWWFNAFEHEGLVRTVMVKDAKGGET